LTITLATLAFAGTAQGEVTIALMPSGTGVGELAARGLSPGLMSAGLGSVPPAQTYMDVSQGNRVFNSLYDEELPANVRGGICGPPYPPAVVERAKSAPADVVPGLLESTLRAAGRSCRVRGAKPGQLPALVRSLSGDDLLIAIERPPPGKDEALAIGIAGRGFDGNLTSDSTRLGGYVLSTDVAPTILQRLGLPVPSEMSGQPIRSEGRIDPEAVESLGDRLATIPGRRGPVIGVALFVWLAALALTILGSRGRAARPAVRGVGLSVVYLPLLLLLAAALEPSQAAERLLVLLGAPLIAALTLALLRGYRALAVASAATVFAYAVDVIAGSPLTPLSLLGPNPGLGVRFYGIGNELEALLAVLVLAGTGAALTGFAPRLSTRQSAFAFLALGLVCAFVFAAGRFGADVGAAIVLPVGAAAAAWKVATPRRWTAPLIVVVPLAALAMLALVDLLSGADAHLTRSVLDAGGLEDLADVAQRRLQLSAQSFTRPIVLVFLPLIAIAAVAAIVERERLATWLRGHPAMSAGLIGALVATLFGALANDSGALMIEIGAAYILAFTAFAWTESAAWRSRSSTQTKSYNLVSHP
jgi:hypothetical protein